MASRYVMQILDRSTGESVCYEPGLKIEKDFIEDCVTAIVKSTDFKLSASSDGFVEACTANIEKRGVGILRTQAHVADDVRDGIRETLLNLGFEMELATMREALATRVQAALESSIRDLKRKVNP